jgi:ABC-type Na+ efflux pump permease subunit
VTLPPWDYLFIEFNDVQFPDLFNPIWIFALVGIVATVILYNVRTRQLKRHQVYVDMYEWILWAAVIFFFLILTYAVFHFDFLFVVITIPIGVAVLIWIRFVRFPPILAAYEAQLARARYYSKRKFAAPEATIRPKRSSRSSRRRR